MNLAIITNKYPNHLEPSALVFLQQLVWSMADIGVDCTVICPLPINIKPSYAKLPADAMETTSQGNSVKVLFPKYIGFGQSSILGLNPARITTSLFERVIVRTINSLSTKFEVLYAHFVTPAGITVSRLSKKLGIPSYMAYGEATMMTIDHFGGPKVVARELRNLSGVIAVSTKNKNQLLEHQIVPVKKIIVVPNGYREDRFCKLEKKEARKRLGLSENHFIVGFVGSFDHRKGISRLIEAVGRLPDIRYICAGKGDINPDSEQCLYYGLVAHEELPWFYNAMDVFVLPTLNEGMSNAIVEAMACGLPIISSNLPFNDDILDDSNSIRIDPDDVDALKAAIRTLRDDPILCTQLSQGSLGRAEELTLDKRAKNILKFMGLDTDTGEHSSNQVSQGSAT